MKKLGLLDCWIAGLLFAAAAMADPTPLHIRMRDSTGSSLDRTVTFTPLDGIRGFYGTNLVPPTLVTIATHGGIADTNLECGNYMVTYSGLANSQMIFWPANPSITNLADPRIQSPGVVSVWQIILGALQAGSNVSLRMSGLTNVLSALTDTNVVNALITSATNDVAVRAIAATNDLNAVLRAALVPKTVLNPNQFGSANSVTNIKSGATLTNILHYGTLTIFQSGTGNAFVISNDSSGVTFAVDDGGNVQVLGSISAQQYNGTVPVGELSGVIGSGHLPYANTNADGMVKSNAFALLQMAAGQQANISPLPLRGTWLYGAQDFGGAPGQTLEDLYLVHMRALQAKPSVDGGNVIGSDLGLFVYSNGIPILNPHNFPSGLQYNKDQMHTNGFLWMAWYDPAHIVALFGSQPVDTEAQRVFDCMTISRMGFDIFWPDPLFLGVSANPANMMLAILTNNNCLVMTSVAVTNSNTGLPMITNMASTALIQYGGPFRVHSHADMNNLAEAYQYCDEVEKWVWRYVGPGHHPWPGYITGTINNPAQNAFLTACAMFSGCLIEAYNLGTDVNWGPFGNFFAMTNAEIREVQMDPAVVCARRVYITNGCWALLKPLKTRDGPNYALEIWNTNASSSQNVTIPWTELNKGAAPTGFRLKDTAYTVYDMVTKSTVGNDQTQIVITGLAATDYKFYKLISTNSGLTISGSAIVGQISGSSMPVTVYHPAAISSITASGAATSDTGVSLAAGTYQITGSIAAHTASSSAGMSVTLELSANPTTLRASDVSMISTADPGADPSSFARTSPTMTFIGTANGTHTVICGPSADSPNKYLIDQFNAMVVLGSTTTLKFTIVQRSATDAVNASILYTDSYALITKVQ